MKKLITVFALVFGVAQLAIGQGVVIQDGFGAGIGINADDNVTSAYGNVGYVTGGIVEFGLSAGRSWLDNTDVTSNSIGPSIGVYPVRQDEDIPLSIGLGGSYTYEQLDGAAQASNLDVTGNTFAGSGLLFHRFQTSESFAAIPQAGAVFQHTTTKVSSGSISNSSSDSVFGFQFGLGLVFMTSESSQFVLTPSVGVSEGDFSGGASLSVLFPSN